MAVTQRAAVVQELAAELLARTPALARSMADHLSASIPELGALEGDGEVFAELRASTESNISQALRLLKLRAGVDQAVLPPEAREFLRGHVRRGLTLPTLLRSYRLGHAWLWDQWMPALQERIHDPDELIAAQQITSAFMIAYARHRGSHPLETLDDEFAGGVAPLAVPSVRDLTTVGWLRGAVSQLRGRGAR